MEMHWSCDCNVGDRDLVAGQPLGLLQPIIKDGCQLEPPWRLSINYRLVRFGLEQRFDNEFHKIDIVALEPDRCLPEQQAVDISAFLQILRIGGVTLKICCILQNCIRLGDSQVAISGRRDSGIWIDLLVFIALVGAGEVVDEIEFVFRTK